MDYFTQYGYKLEGEPEQNGTPDMEERISNVSRWFKRLEEYQQQQEEEAFVNWFMGA